MLRRSDRYRNDLYLRLMGHDEDNEIDPEYWNRVKTVLGPMILDILNDDNVFNDKTHRNDITLDDVVST